MTDYSPRLVGGFPGRQASLPELADAWERESAAYVNPIKHVLLTCAAEVRASLLAFQDPEAYAALSEGMLPPPPPAG